MKKGTAFVVKANVTDHLTSSAQSAVKYDLIGKLAEDTQLTRKTIATILRGINVAIFTAPSRFSRPQNRFFGQR